MNPLFNFAPPEIDLAVILPALIVALTGIFALIAEMARPKKNNDFIVWVSLAGLLLAGLLTGRGFAFPAAETMGGMAVHDTFGSLMQFAVILATFLAVAFSEGYLRDKRIPFGEFYPLVLWSATGAMIMCGTTNLLMIFIGLEILSVSLYVMAGMSRTEEGSSESALKYFLLGAFASGFLLYGIALIYGATGTLSLESITSVWMHRDPTSRSLIVFGVGLILIGLGFKASLVPFHQWTPDVYQGAPTNVAAFMATGSKIAAFAAITRVLESAVLFRAYWMPALSVLAVLTMCVGNLVAVTQKDVKRILGYSSIAQAGYVLVAILSHVNRPQDVGTGTITYYMFGYTAMTIGAFAIVSSLARENGESTRLEDLRGLYRRSPFAAFALVVFMASLIGIPPTVGFAGKLFIFNDAIRAGLTPLAIVLAVNSIVSAYYYLAIARAAVTDAGTETESRPIKLNPGVLGACALGLVGVVGAVLPPVFQVFTQR